MIPAYVIEMLQLQDSLNRLVHEDWIHQNYDWSRAVMVESVELLDHIGWKWWKKQEIDLDQAHLELVDIWHFILSHALEEAEGNVQRATLTLMQDWQVPLENIVLKLGPNTPDNFAELDLLRQIEIFGSLAGLTGIIVLPLFRCICEQLHLSESELFEMYIKKNVLNLFRQQNGYKEGRYIKVWNGKEDNEVLADIINETSVLDPHQLINQLKTRYADVLAAK